MKLRGNSLFFGAVGALAVVGLMGSAALADGVYVGSVELDLAPYQIGYGGEFTAHLTYVGNAIGDVANQGMPPATSAAGANNASATTAIFETFCIEEGPVNDVTFVPGYDYYAATIGPDALNSHGTTLTLNGGTAYLFDQFWKGTLKDYNFSNSVTFTNSHGDKLSRQLDAGALQAAIWALQGDNTLSGAESDASISGAADTLALEYYNLGLANASSNLVPPVEVFGMYDTKADALAGGVTGIAQAQLVEVSPSFSGTVPLPASAGVGFATLAGIGTLFAFRKRFGRGRRMA